MAKRKKQYILPQMFDIRPVKQTGDLDLDKMKTGERVVKIKPKRLIPVSKKKIGEVFYDVKRPSVMDEEVSRFQKVIAEEKRRKKIADTSAVSVNLADLDIPGPVSINLEGWMPAEEIQPDMVYHQEVSRYYPPQSRLGPIEPEMKYPQLDQTHPLWGLDYFDKFSDPSDNKKKKGIFSFFSRKKAEGIRDLSDRRKIFPTFAIVGLSVVFLIFAVNIFAKGMSLKKTSLIGGQEAYAQLSSAKDSLASHDFDKASFEFNAAYNQFNQISGQIDDLGQVIVDVSKYVPFTSQLSSGAHLVQAGKDISQIGLDISSTLQVLDKIKNPLNTENGQSVSFLDIFQETNKNLKEISSLTQDLEDNLDNVNIDDIPQNQRAKFVALKQNLPQINQFLAGFNNDSQLFSDILGGNGPRKYLFLFQNNQEMRATGGFIGSYGVLDIANGRVSNFFIDGIFDPDGQLKEKVIPPVPIQKISAAWSLHDSNWFPDFPVSAEKACWFYEKTGGPTVDGVITMTPTVMQKLLEITGPIDMPAYNLTVDKDNFVAQVQNQVENNYDKEENQPKKILADLAPIILDRIFNTKDVSSAAKVMDVLIDSLNEKQILLYSKNYDIEKIISDRGWSGEVLNAPKDYISVINTNINGYKTDGVIDETISHEAQIQDDGSIIDTLTVTRHHNGGQTPYDFWNKVNADYMRVYVPQGSKLISVSGETQEFDSPPLDYQALGFKQDPQVAMEENNMQVDDSSGTRIYDDAGKTVFANWTYVSPQETMEIKYTYLLPFKIDINQKDKPSDSYSLLVQKQSGSIGSKFSEDITYPGDYNAIWKYPNDKTTADDLSDGQKEIRMDDVLSTDKFVGVALTQ